MTPVDVIVLDLDGESMLSLCLESIAKQKYLPARVIVWDNGSREPVTARIPGNFPFELRIERSDGNLGFTGGINQAMALVTAPFVAWLNNDAQLDREWLEVLMREFETDERLGAVQSRIRRDEFILDGAGIDISSGTYVQAGHGAPISGYVESRPPWGVSATAALYRTSALRSTALGPAVLHPAFFAWYEDVELCARLHEGGWRTRVVAKVLAAHQGSASVSRIGRRARLLRARNRYWTARLHPGVGRISALLAEDLRITARLLAALKVHAMLYHVAGIALGLLGRIDTLPGRR